MAECAQRQRLILVAASEASDASLIRAAVEELGLVPVLVQDDVAASHFLCRSPRQFAAAVAGERIGPTSGLTLCGVARDAGCRLPMLLLTHDDCRWTAIRAARLQVTVLRQPASARRLAQTLRPLLPRKPCAADSNLGFPATPLVEPRVVPAPRIDSVMPPAGPQPLRAPGFPLGHCAATGSA